MPLSADSDTVNVRSACPLSPSVTLALPIVTVGGSSLSSSVSDTPVTDSVLLDAWLFAAVPVTVPVRLSSSRLLSTAVMVTVSASVVSPAAISISASDSTVYRPLTSVMVTVVAALDVVPPLSVAVTSAVPPFSAIDGSSNDSVTVGGSSSSVNVTDTEATAPTPWLFCAEPVTVAVASGASWLLSAAVSVADCSAVVSASELEVSPASIVSVVRFSAAPDAGCVSVTVVA